MQQKQIAHVKNPTIEAAVGGLFRFPDEATAKARLSTIREHFVTSRHQQEGADSVILWIKGYDISKDEKKEGYLGNFALLHYEFNKKDKIYTITAKKLEADLNHHPQRKRPKRSMPDWGHPILRGIKNGKVYATPDDAQAALNLLHEEFPGISIPCTHKMYIMIYERQPHKKDPVTKLVLNLVAARDGSGFVVEWEYNDYKPPRELPKSVTGEASAGGYHSNMVWLKKHKKDNQWKGGEKPEDDVPGEVNLLAGDANAPVGGDTV